MLEAKNISKRYGDIHAVKGISFSVQKGDILGFLGPNGAGKTTTMRIMTGALPASSGTAVIAGFDIAKDALEVKKRIGYLPETPPLYFDFTVEAYLKFVSKLRDIAKAKRKDAIEWAIEKCNLQDVSKRMIGNLSKGFKQRVGLAQAIVHKPDVLILDEPTVGLDPTQIREIRELITDLSKEHTVILSTHILPEVNMICNRAVFINQGQIAMAGDISELTRDKSLEEVFVDVVLKGNKDRASELAQSEDKA